jgi:DNA-binding transcriptional ArsR family regulator
MSPNRRRAKKLVPIALNASINSDKLVNFKAEFFKALANPIRIKILDELRSEELTVSEIRDRLSVELPNVSQQLAVLKGKKLVVARKQGNNIYYSCIDPTVFKLLDVAKQIFNNHLVDVQETLSQL